MKKILILSIIMIMGMCAFSQSTSPRFGTTKNQDNTFRTLTNVKIGYTFVSGADTIKLNPNAFQTFVMPDSLADSLLVRFTPITRSYFGDRVFFTAIAKGSSRKVKFYATNLSAGATLTCLQNKRVTITFMFDGIKWVEISRYTES